jgi:hypothetical protein
MLLLSCHFRRAVINADVDADEVEGEVGEGSLVAAAGVGEVGRRKATR